MDADCLFLAPCRTTQCALLNGWQRSIRSPCRKEEPTRPRRRYLIDLRHVPEPSGTFMRLAQVSPFAHAIPAMPPHISPSFAATCAVGGDSVLGTAEGGATIGALAVGTGAEAFEDGELVPSVVLEANEDETGSTGTSAGFSQATNETKTRTPEPATDRASAKRRFIERSPKKEGPRAPSAPAHTKHADITRKSIAQEAKRNDDPHPVRRAARRRKRPNLGGVTPVGRGRSAGLGLAFVPCALLPFASPFP